MLAEHHGEPVAGALNLMGRTALYGRNWGCKGEWPFLHFELCYYRAIDFAIEHGLQRVEAGAQGQHKIQRGYLPKPTYSAHWLSHAGLKPGDRRLPATRAPGGAGGHAGAGDGVFALSQGGRGVADSYGGAGPFFDPLTRPSTPGPAHAGCWGSRSSRGRCGMAAAR